MKEIKALEISTKAFTDVASQYHSGSESNTTNEEKDSNSKVKDEPIKNVETKDAPKPSDVFKKR